MSASRTTGPVQIPLDALRTELADLAFELERQGRRDAADVVMMLDARLCEAFAPLAAAERGDESIPANSATFEVFSP